MWLVVFQCGSSRRAYIHSAGGGNVSEEDGKEYLCTKERGFAASSFKMYFLQNLHAIKDCILQFTREPALISPRELH